MGNKRSETFYYYHNRLIIFEVKTPHESYFYDSVKYTYTNKGEILSRTVYSSDDGISGYISFLEKYQYIGDTTTIEIDELKTFKEDTLHTVSLNFLKKGKNKILVPKHNLADSIPKKLETFEKDKKGNIILFKNDMGIITTRKKYDSKNKLVLEQNYKNNGDLEQINTYTYKKMFHENNNHGTSFNHFNHRFKIPLSQRCKLLLVYLTYSNATLAHQKLLVLYSVQLTILYQLVHSQHRFYIS